jgi:hypothetical protein
VIVRGRRAVFVFVGRRKGVLVDQKSAVFVFASRRRPARSETAVNVIVAKIT